MKKLILLVVLLLLNLPFLQAADITWDGGGDGTTWTQGTNWVGNVAPLTTDNAIFDAVTVTITSGSAITIVGLTIRNSGNITFTPNITHNGVLTIQNASTVVFNGTVSASGSAINSDTGGPNAITYSLSSTMKDMNINAATTITVNTTFSFRRFVGAFDLTFNGSGTITNGTKISSVASGATFTYSGTGTYTHNVNTLAVLTGGAIVNSGNFISNSTITNDGTFTNNSTFTNNGTIKGIGTITQSGTFTNAAGSFVEPGQSPGTLTITGDLSINSGTLKCEINGTTASTLYDVLDVSGTATIVNGSSKLNLVFGYVASANDAFDIVTAGTVSGTFAIGDITFSGGNVTAVDVTYPGGKVTVTVSAILPVELVFFDARLQGETTLLSWQTASETNNEGFEIEHSPDGKNWRNLATIKGQGTTFELQNYSYLHENPQPGLNYYRLKQMDYDGKFEYSKIVSVDLTDLENPSSFWVYPNPVSKGELTLYFPKGLEEEAFTLTLYSLAGQLLIQQKDVELPKTLDISGLGAGVYLLEVISGSKSWKERFVVQ